jgi:hypothetical protein
VRYLLHHIRSLLKSYEAKSIVSPGKAIDYQTKTIDTKLFQLKDLYVDGLIENACHHELNTVG